MPVKGGVQRVVSALVEAQTADYHTILSTSDISESESRVDEKLKVVLARSYLEIASLPIAPMLVWRYWRESKKADVIVVHYPFPLADLAIALSLSSPPIIVYWHSDIVAQSRLKWLVAPFTYLLLLRAKSIVVTSDRVSETSWWLKKFRKKIIFIPYGTQPVRVHPLTQMPFESFYLMVGRHVSYKGFDVGIKAMQFHNQNMVIVGRGPLLSKHVELARQLGVAERILFVTDATDEDIAGYMESCLGLVFPSNAKNEAFGLVQIEAMSRSKPIVNTMLPSSVPWVARNGQEAITVSPGNANALALAITKLAENPDLAEELGANGCSRYEEMFTMDKFSVAMERLYASVVVD